MANKINTLDQLRSCAEKIKGYIGGLISKLASTTAAALEEMDAAKLDKRNYLAITLPTTGWVSSSGEYPYYYDVAIDGLTAEDLASVNLSHANMNKAKRCGLCPSCQTLTGKVRMRAKRIPSASITAQCWIEKGLV